MLLVKKSRLVKLLATLAVCLAASQSAVAQDAYPTRTIRFIVAFSPGGIADTIARLVAKGVSEKLGQTIVVENKGGAAGALGAKYVSTAEPNGYIFLVTTSALTLGAAAYPNAVDPRTQLVPIAIAASSPTIIATKRGTKSRNLSDFLSQQKDGFVSYASAGTGTVEHLTAAYVLRSEHATHVPFRSGGEALNAVLSSQVDLSTTPLGSAIAFVDNGQIQPLAVASRERLAALPNVPTFGECGLPNIESDSWVAIFGPKGLPLPIAQRLNAEVNKLLEQSDYRERLTTMGFSIREMSQPRFAEVTSEEVAKWSKVLKETGVELK